MMVKTICETALLFAALINVHHCHNLLSLPRSESDLLRQQGEVLMKTGEMMNKHAEMIDVYMESIKRKNTS